MADILLPLCKHVLGQLGQGHTECVYHKALTAELNASPLFTEIEVEKNLPIMYRNSYSGHEHTVGICRVDIMYWDLRIGKRVLVELKASSTPLGLAVVHQINKYRRLLNEQVVAYAVNFNQGKHPTVELVEIDA